MPPNFVFWINQLVNWHSPDQMPDWFFKYQIRKLVDEEYPELTPPMSTTKLQLFKEHLLMRET